MFLLTDHPTDGIKYYSRIHTVYQYYLDIISSEIGSHAGIHLALTRR